MSYDTRVNWVIRWSLFPTKHVTNNIGLFIVSSDTNFPEINQYIDIFAQQIAYEYALFWIATSGPFYQHGLT